MTNTIIGTTADDNIGGDTNASDLNDSIEGLAGFDTLFGLLGNDSLYGGEGNDFILGGAGDDFVDGGDGFDYAYWDGGPNGVVANLAKGKASGWGHDTFVNIEGLVGGTHDDKLIGDAFNNGLAGLEGNDTLIGGDGEDTAFYNFAVLPVTVDLAAGTSSGSQDNDILIGIEDVMTGAGDDVVIGSKGNNAEFGIAGNDTLGGAAGSDQLVGDLGNDSLDGGKGMDSLFGGFDNDILLGGTQGDYLYGDDGADTLIGGYAGGDTLGGGLGADIFRFLDADMSAGWVDSSMFDFFASDGDVIDLSDVDANTDKAGNQAFKIVGSLTKAGQVTLTFDSNTFQTHVEAQTDADAATDLSFFVNGHVTSGAGFVL